VKTFSASFSLNGNQTSCAHDSRKGDDKDSAYYCGIRGGKGAVTCDGRGLFAGTEKCKFSVDVVEETILVSVFKERYT